MTDLRKNLLWMLALLTLCGLTARWTTPYEPPGRTSSDYGDHSPLARLPDATLTIAGVGLGMPKAELLKIMGRPASYSKVREGLVLTFARVMVVISEDKVIWVSGTELEQNGQRVRAGGNPREVMQAIPGFEALELAQDKIHGGLTTLYWPQSNLRSDTVLATDAWCSEYALGREPMIRERPPGGQRLLPF